MNRKQAAYAAAILAAVLWGGNFVVLRLALEHFDPYLLTALRFGFVALLLPFVGWPQVPVSVLLLYALCSGICQYLLSTLSIQLGLSPGLAALVMQFQVFVSLALSYVLLRESVRVTTIVGSVLGLAGLAGVLATGGSKAPWIATMVCLLAATGWAFANLIVKRHPESIVRLQSASGLICLPFVWLARELLIPDAAPALLVLENAPLSAWAQVAYAVVASFAVAQVLWSRAIGAVGIAPISPIALLIPVFGVTLAWIVLGDRLSVQLVVSCGVVLMGVGLHMIALRRSILASQKVAS